MRRWLERLTLSVNDALGIALGGLQSAMDIAGVQARVLQMTRQVPEGGEDAYSHAAWMTAAHAGLGGSASSPSPAPAPRMATTTTKNTTTTTSSSSSSSSSALGPRLMEVLAQQISLRFDRDRADQLLTRAEKPQWLASMLDNARYRKMLIDLYNSHSDSTLLGLCLRDISARGHHAEISQIIRESDYYEVFNDILSEIICKVVLGTDAETGGRCESDEELIMHLRGELKRSCCSAEYSYLYAISLLRDIEEATQGMITGNAEAHDTAKLQLLLFRSRRLRGDLEEAASWSQKSYPSSAFNAADLTTRSLVGHGGNGGGFINTGVSLDPSSLFAVKLSGDLVLPPSLPPDFASSGGLSQTTRVKGTLYELLDMLKNNKASSNNLERLCVYLYDLSSDVCGTDISVYVKAVHSLSVDAHPLDANYANSVALLQHPHVLRVLVDACMGH